MTFVFNFIFFVYHFRNLSELRNDFINEFVTAEILRFRILRLRVLKTFQCLHSVM